MPDYQNIVQDVLHNVQSSKDYEEVRTFQKETDDLIRTKALSFIFPDINPNDIKIDTKILDHTEQNNHIKRKRVMLVPFNAFFYPYTLGIENNMSDVRIRNDLDRNVYIEIDTEFGNFWFLALSFDSDIKASLELKSENLYDDNIPRLTLCCKLRSGDEARNAIVFSRIDPYICVNCDRHVPGMKKCEACWKNLKICVRYCSEECQREDYLVRHRHYCGCKAGSDRSRRKEFDSRTSEAKHLTLLSLEDSANAL